MKVTIFAFTVLLTGFCCLNLVAKTNSDTLLIGLAFRDSKNSLPGAGTDSATAIGMNLDGMSQFWTQLEPTPGHYDLQTYIVNPLIYIDPGHTKIKSFILVLRMLDSNLKIVPSDLMGVSFGSQQMTDRFLRLIDSIAASSHEVKWLSHILIGNEVDIYLSSHPAEVDSFLHFYKAAIDRIHLKMPGTKVGTIITFNNASSNTPLFNKLKADGDFICYTYYPDDTHNIIPWQMRPPADAKADIGWMASHTGNKPFAMTEIGYTSSAANNSSESLQASFVSEMFDTLSPYVCNGKVEFIFYHGMFDYPTGICGPYGRSQGLTDTTQLCGFMENLGLNRWATGQPKLAWNMFVQKLKRIHADPCSTTGIRESINNNNQIVLYPNPSTGKISIDCYNKQGLNLSVYDLAGKLMLVQQLKNKNEIDMSVFSKGIYFYRIISEKEILKTGKIILE